MLVLSHVAEADILQRFVDQPLLLRLFQNDLNPGMNATAQQLTEATFEGYAPIILSTGEWQIRLGRPTRVTHAQQVFESATGQNQQLIYGYYVTKSSGLLMWSERFTDGPYLITNLGDQLKITPSLAVIPGEPD